MKVTIGLVLLGLIGVAGLTANALAFEGTQYSHYPIAEVMDFATGPNVRIISQSHISTLSAVISGELKATRMFQQVCVGNDALKTAKGPDLRIIGEFREFRTGNPWMAYFSAGFAGHTRIRVHVRFVDSASGKTLLQEDLRGTARLGSELRAREEIAQAITKIVRNNFE